MYIKIARTRDVEMPNRFHAHDAGMDFFVPRFDSEFVKSFQTLKQNKEVEINDSEINLRPGQGAMIPSGVHVEIPIGYMGIFQNKSGTATKKRLLIGAQVVDTGYTGEVHIHVVNVSDRLVTVSGGEKLTQMVLVPIAVAVPIEGELDSFYEGLNEHKLRETGGFGSTGI